MQRSIDTSYTRVGFVGAGTMGRPIIHRMAEGGYLVRVFDIDESRARACIATGVEVVVNLSVLFASTDVLLLSLPSPDAVDDVTARLFEHTCRPRVIVDLSTNGPDCVARLAERCRAAGLVFLESPLSGGPWAARNGSLTAMVGGDADDLDYVRPLLCQFASTVVHIGPHGCGAIAKLIHNMVGEIQVQAFAEAFCLAARLGLDLNRFYEVLANGMASSRILTHLFAAGGLRRNWFPNVTVNAATKDQVLLGELFKRAEVQPVFSTGVLDRLRKLQMAGHGHKDVTATLLLFEAIYGTEVSVDPSVLDGSFERADDGRTTRAPECE